MASSRVHVGFGTLRGLLQQTTHLLCNYLPQHSSHTIRYGSLLQCVQDLRSCRRRSPCCSTIALLQLGRWCLNRHLACFLVLVDHVGTALDCHTYITSDVHVTKVLCRSSTATSTKTSSPSTVSSKRTTVTTSLKERMENLWILNFLQLYRQGLVVAWLISCLLWLQWLTYRYCLKWCVRQVGDSLDRHFVAPR